MKSISRRFGATALTIAALAGCGSDDGSAGRGTVQVTIWGEEYVERGIPADVFEDGWSVRFQEFLVMLTGYYLGGDAGGQESEAATLFDLVKPGPHPVGTFELSAGAWPEFGYTIGPAASETVGAETASAEQLEFMLDNGHGLFVAGVASRDGEEKSFAWGFGNTTRYDGCVSEMDGREVAGIDVVNGGKEVVEITVHGDHFFYDDLASQSAVPRFDAIAAADVDNDGEVSLGELSELKLVEIPVGTYGTGSASQVDDLGAFVRALTTTVGHFRGEGHCVASGG